MKGLKNGKDAKYVGRDFSVKGARSDQPYVKSVLNLKIKVFLKALGMIDCLTKYLLNLCKILYYLRSLIKNNVELHRKL